jgi:Skp family chaperone for outer membrane proteins
MKAVLLCLCLALSLTACGAAAHRTATVAIVSTGVGIAALHANHDRVYREATDALRARLRARDAPLADYDREVAPLDAAHRARGEAIQALDVAAYGAAALSDAAKSGRPADYVAAARHLLDALRRGLAVLRDGAVLPAVPIPAELTRVTDQLATLAGGG